MLNLVWTALVFCLAICLNSPFAAHGQSATFAGNAQHTGNFPVAAQRLSSLHWTAPVDLDNTGEYAHYGEPLVTPSNTVIIPVKISTNTFEIIAYDGPTGRLKYILTNDFVQVPFSGWIATYQPVLAYPNGILTLCYPGAGGTVYYLQNPDSGTPGAPSQVCFYTNLSAYQGNSSYKTAVYINTPITSDTNGDLFFGFRVQLTVQNAPATNGFARIDASGNGSYVAAPTAANDSTMAYTAHNVAPALSLDGSTVYVVPFASDYTCYLVGLNTTNLSTKYRVKLVDPTVNQFAQIQEDGTSSPTVGPDGDVFFGIWDTGSIGVLLHYSGDLQTVKTPGAFGWDNTVAIVPTNMLPGYNGPSSYLLFSKYNYYSTGDNKIALLDPNAPQLDSHPARAGFTEMRELLTVPGFTYGGASVREWCVNTAAVDPATHSIFASSEDGQIYRWNVASNGIAEVVPLTAGISEPYVPVCVGPDGGVYTLNGGFIFALGALSNVDVAIYSSAPDLRLAVKGQPLTFTAVVSNYNSAGPVPTGTATFLDKYYVGNTAITNTLAAAVPLSNGVASVSTAALFADGTNNASHFITAEYSGDPNFPAGKSTLVEKIHAYASITTVTSATVSSGVSFTATVSGGPASAPVPTGFAAFYDGTNFLEQLPLGTNGSVSYVITNFSAAPHSITATYTSDRLYAASTASVIAPPIIITSATIDTNGLFRLSFTNAIGASFTVISTPDLTLPLSNWSVLGRATEVHPGVFQFEDSNSTRKGWQFYRVRSP